jgi:hypothetical protein
MWSLGCVLAEMLQDGKVLFEGSTDIDMLSKMFTALGPANVSSMSVC